MSLGSILGAAIGAATGFGALGTAAGSFIGSKLSGDSTKKSLRNAGIAGFGSYALGEPFMDRGPIGAGIGSFLDNKAGISFGSNPGQVTSTSGGLFGLGKYGTQFAQKAGASGVGIPAVAPGASTAVKALTQGAGKQQGMGTIGKLGLAGLAAGALSGPEEAPTPSGGLTSAQSKFGERDPSYGGNPGMASRIVTGADGERYFRLVNGRQVKISEGGKINRTALAQAQQENARLGQQMAKRPVVEAKEGGYIEGPGTGTSDSIPAKIYQDGQPVQEARLSDGEFVFTKSAVDGAGGPAQMYKMMKKFESRVA